MICFPVNFYRWSRLQDYSKVHDEIMAYAYDVCDEKACESVWLLSHFPVYTLGANASSYIPQNLCIPVYRSGRGGLLTFHGPEQRMIYPFVHLKRRELTVTTYLDILEKWILNILNKLGIYGNCTKERRGVWIQNNKIASIGIQIKRNVAFHGMALNLYSPSKAFLNISPCGLDKKFGMTSLDQLGFFFDYEEIDGLIRRTCPF
ncbi:octanoyltransferase [Holospora obtusa F1]|uniref:Octanoyltransferase n=1 Tax=Holospora obtusa F1 TaxID=1399147 RepID=W6TF27_HOLOB|nr:lipoyl(octanoyl) transferase LipB [Holospora obtusa]ETZ07559.1 octanoyltransferase [Holospora obtusa F1]